MAVLYDGKMGSGIGFPKKEREGEGGERNSTLITEFVSY
jgi:hypothetical protein